MLQMFNSLKSDTSNTISIKFLYDILGRMGLHNDDIRLQVPYTRIMHGRALEPDVSLHLLKSRLSL